MTDVGLLPHKTQLWLCEQFAPHLFNNSKKPSSDQCVDALHEVKVDFYDEAENVIIAAEDIDTAEGHSETAEHHGPQKRKASVYVPAEEGWGNWLYRKFWTGEGTLMVRQDDEEEPVVEEKKLRKQPKKTRVVQEEEPRVVQEEEPRVVQEEKPRVVQEREPRAVRKARVVQEDKPERVRRATRNTKKEPDVVEEPAEEPQKPAAAKPKKPAAVKPEAAKPKKPAAKRPGKACPDPSLNGHGVNYDTPGFIDAIGEWLTNTRKFPNVKYVARGQWAAVFSSGSSVIKVEAQQDPRDMKLYPTMNLLQHKEVMRLSDFARRKLKHLAQFVDADFNQRMTFDGKTYRISWISMKNAGKPLQGPMSEAEAKKAFKAMAEALGELHGTGYVHNDVNDGNFLSDGKQVTLIDFGLVEKPMLSEGCGSQVYLSLSADQGNSTTYRDDYESAAYIAWELMRPLPWTGKHSQRIAMKASLEGAPTWIRDIILKARAAGDYEIPTF